MQRAQQRTALVGRHHAQHLAQAHLLVRTEAAYAQRLQRQQHAELLIAAPLEAAHACEVLGARELGLAALELQARARAAQQVTQAAGQQAPLRRLDEKVGRPGFVGTRDGRVVVEPGEHQHRHVLAAGELAQRAAGLEAVQPRHHRVEHDDIERAFGEHRQRALTARRLDDLEAALAQRDGRQQQVDLVVVDEQHQRAFGQVVEG